MVRRLAAGLSVLLLACLPSAVMATPYASGVQLNGASSSFVLNENADNVSVVYDGGATVVDMGGLSAGSHVFDATLGASWEIVCSKSAPAGWTQISDDNLTQSKYYSPKGVAVNRNAGSTNFGRVYVSEGLGGAVGAGGRTTTDGIYVMTADQGDVLSQGDTAYAGGVDWSTSSYSPHKISIAPDDSVYMVDWSDTHSGVWRCSADPQATFDEILTNVGRDANGLVAGVHGSVAAAWIEGTGADTKLYTVDEDYPDAGGTYGVGRGDILRYDIGTSTGYSSSPAIQVADDTPTDAGIILNGLMDLVRDEDGTWWIAQYRYTEGVDAPSLTHWQDGATGPDFNSAEAGLGLNRAYGSIDIHNGNNLLAMGTNDGQIFILDISGASPVVVDAIAHSGSTIRDVAFDAAGNLYVVSSSSETLRIYSPGGDWVATTGSDGSFTLVPEPATLVLLSLGGLLLRRRRS